jgi:carboxyl-terminal processing protease
MRLSEAVDLIQGEPGQKVSLTVLHEGGRDPVDIDIVRDEIRIQSVLGDSRKDDNLKEWDFVFDKQAKIGYIRLTNFSETATKEMKSALEELQKQEAHGLVLDLRNNPGGLLRAAVEISNMFLKEGRIVSTKGRNHRDESYEARPENTLPYFADRFPIAILVNRYSASASEIVAAALQDNGRATVFGERSYGKGSVQNIIVMERDTSALKLTTASYWRPSGKNIHRFPESKDKDDWGVKPDQGCEVPMKDEERMDYMIWRSERDIVRKKNAETDRPVQEKKEGKPKDGKEAKKKQEFKDRVMDKAMEHLRKEVDKLRAADRLPLERGDA